jgi:aminoglycoside phosphotransferase
MSKQIRRLHTLWRGASGAVVWLTSDDTSGELLAVKSASAGAAETLRREGHHLARLCSPHIIPWHRSPRLAILQRLRPI